MKKFMRRHARHKLVRRHANRGGVCVFHPSTTRAFSNVEDERVAFKWRAFHEFYFVLANPFQVLFRAFPLPVFSVNHDRDRRSDSRNLKLFKFPSFDGRVSYRIVARGAEDKLASPAYLFQRHKRRASGLPLQRNVRHGDAHVLGTPVRHIHQNHGGVDERMLGIELRAERSGFVPIRRITKLNRSRSPNAPRLLVQLFDGCFFCSYEGFHLLDVRAEIANLVEGIPRGPFNRDFSRNIGNGHGQVKQVPLGMFQRNAVVNRGVAGNAEHQQRKEMEEQRFQQAFPTKEMSHRALASLETCAGVLSFFSSFSHKPSKLPFDMINKRSPALASAAKCAAMASAPEITCASVPSARTPAATDSGSNRFSSPNCCAR